MLAADSQFDLGTDSPPIFNSYPYESSYPLGVKHLEWVVCKDTPIYIGRKEPARIVAA